jgi:hypothetical protein
MHFLTGFGLAECRLNIDAQLGLAANMLAIRSSTLQNGTSFRGCNEFPFVHLRENWDKALPEGSVRRPMLKDALQHPVDKWKILISNLQPHKLQSGGWMVVRGAALNFCDSVRKGVT